MEFGRAPRSGKTIVWSLFFLAFVTAAGLAGIWMIWDNLLNDDFQRVIEYFS